MLVCRVEIAFPRFARDSAPRKDMVKIVLASEEKGSHLADIRYRIQEMQHYTLAD